MVYPSRWAMVFGAIGSMVFVAFGANLVGEFPDSAFDFVAGTAAIAFFSLTCVYFFFRLAVRRPALVVDGHGLTDNATAMGVGFVGWEEVKRVTVYRFMGQKVLGIEVHDPNAIAARVGVVKRLAMKANMKIGCSPINIPAVVPGGLETLEREIQKYLEAGRF